MTSIIEYFKMSRFRKLVFFITIIAFVGIFLLFQTGSKHNTRKTDVESMFFEENFDDTDLTEEEKKHRNMLKDGKLNIPELGLNFIENMEHNKKKATTTPKPPFKPELMLMKNPPIFLTKNMSDGMVEENFFKYLETKDVICKNDERVGFQHDGGWNVCMSPPFGFHEPCIVYSFGIGNDWRFDRVSARIYNCTVYAFDPSIPIPTEKLHPRIHFEQVGIGGRNSKGLKTFSTILREHGHSETVIDYLKFDIEYMEWAVLENLLREKSFKNVKQIGFEIHTNEFYQHFKKLKDVKFNSGKDDFLYMYHTIKKLEDYNFRQFNYRLNPFGEYGSPITRKKRSCCYELHFLNMNFVTPNYTTTLT
ncbi:probable methyltransferase-like protein 24 [Mytilus californianus]|uniref:probable methyltransferase-like protein 24 n=1 Tax=Mytilus californianus TaxID=6549 RepID=UPI002245637A|nr:probable methyltransferase-like protein 24 [Mytilus californianus]